MASTWQNRSEPSVCQPQTPPGRKPQAASKGANRALRPRGLMPGSANTKPQRRRQRSLAGALISADERRCRRRAGDARPSRACACVCAESIKSLADAPRKRDTRSESTSAPPPSSRETLAPPGLQTECDRRPPIAAAIMGHAGREGQEARERGWKRTE